MALPALLPQPLTLPEAAEIDPDAYPGEVVDGEWTPVSRNTWNHGVVVGNVYAVLRGHVKAQGGWSVSVGDPGVRLAQDPALLRGPDVAVLREERRPVGSGADGWVDGAPELCVEVVGSSQLALELVRKAQEYLRAGCRLAWVVDPQARLVLVLDPEQRLRILGPEDELTGGDVLPGFSCPVAELFE
jgi:Uma2 family endonuclease